MASIAGSAEESLNGTPAPSYPGTPIPRTGTPRPPAFLIIPRINLNRRNVTEGLKKVFESATQKRREELCRDFPERFQDFIYKDWHFTLENGVDIMQIIMQSDFKNTNLEKIINLRREQIIDLLNMFHEDYEVYIDLISYFEGNKTNHDKNFDFFFKSYDIAPGALDYYI